MRGVTLIICSFLLFSCTLFHRHESEIYKKLVLWDKPLYKSPKAYLDSLSTLDTSGISKNDKAYFTLLQTIAYIKCNYSIVSDSEITIVFNWFNGRDDYKNICRAALYKSLINTSLNIWDREGYSNLLKSEKLFQKHSIVDPDFENQIYTELAKNYILNISAAPDAMEIIPIVNEYDSNSLNESAEQDIYRKPINLLKKSIKINERQNNIEGLYKAKLELSDIFIGDNKIKEAELLLRTFEHIDSLKPEIQFDYYNAYNRINSISELNGEEESIFCLKKMATLIKKFSSKKQLLSEIYLEITNNYRKIGNIDSMLFYSKIALETASNEQVGTLHLYYKYLSDAYMLKGDFKLAYENFKLTWEKYLRYSGNLNKIKNQKNEDDLALRISKMDKAYNLIIFFALLCTILIICFIITINKFRKDKKILKEHALLLSVQIENLKYDQNRLNLIKILQENSVKSLPKLIEDVTKIANKCRKLSGILADELIDSLNSIRAISKSNISELAQNESFLSVNQNLKFLTSLSDLEIVILILVELKFNTKEISELLNNSEASVRAIKTKIKDKILSTKGLPFNPESSFLIFSK